MSTWSGVSAAYARSFAALCAGTIPSVLDALPGSRLLDVGSGTGTLTAAARARGYEVTAVDSDPDMVAMTEAVAPGTCRRAALPNLPFPSGHVDAVAANFVVNHLEDPRAGVRELARVMARDGRLAMTVWPPGGAQWSVLVNAAFDEAGAAPWQGARLPAERDFDRTPEGLAVLAEEAGLTVTRSETLAWVWDVAPDDLWAGIAGGVATPGARFRAQSAEGQERVRGAFERLAAESMVDGRLQFACTASLVVARHP